MIEKLRKLDRLYFGPRVGRGSATSMALALITGFTPWAFARRCWNMPEKREEPNLRLVR